MTELSEPVISTEDYFPIETLIFVYMAVAGSLDLSGSGEGGGMGEGNGDGREQLFATELNLVRLKEA